MSLRILIIDDDKHTRRIIEAFVKHDPELALLHPEVVVAQDGIEGMDALETGPFDLVMSDLLMPRMDGFKFCRELRRHKFGKEVPLIVTSAVFKDPGTVTKLQRETGAAFMSKPFVGPDLLSLIRKTIGKTSPVSVLSALEAAVTPKPQAAPEVIHARKRTPVPLRPRPEPAPSIAIDEESSDDDSAACQPQKGTLADRAPSRILLDLWELTASGTLTIERGKVLKEIILVQGKPVHVKSNVRTETLGQFLVMRGVIDEKKHQAALQRAQETKSLYGKVLVDLGWITQRDLLFQLSSQMRMKIASLLRWKEGTWSFNPTPPEKNSAQFPIDTPRLVFAGLKKTAKVDEIAATFGGGFWRIALTPRAEHHRDAFDQVFGEDKLTLFTRNPTIQSLSAGPDPDALLIQVDVLLACGLAELEPSEVSGPDMEESDPLALERISSAEFSVPRPTGLSDDLFNLDEPDPRGKRTASDPALADAQVIVLDWDDEVADPSQDGARQNDSSRDPEHRAALDAFSQQIVDEYLNIHSKDYFEVLSLSRNCSIAEVATNYGAISSRFPIERFTPEELNADYVRLLELHEIFRKAFETLSSAERRQKYVQSLSLPAASSGAIEAELAVQEATALLASGQAASAREKLEIAVAAAPDQADYHALLGWAAFLSEGGRSTDENDAKSAACIAWPHLDQALSIDLDNVRAHEYAGRICSATGDDERAVEHLERAVSIDDSRAEILAELEMVLVRQANWPRLERHYRRLIHSLSAGADASILLPLWLKLGDLYRLRLEDPASARIAYQGASTLAPKDPRPRESLTLLDSTPTDVQEVDEGQFEGVAGSAGTAATEPDDVPDEEDVHIDLAPSAGKPSSATQLRSTWLSDLTQLHAGLALFQFHSDRSDWDDAFRAASALVALGSTDAAATEFYETHRARLLPRAQLPIDGDLFGQVRHADDDPAIDEVLQALFAVYQPAVSLTSLGVTTQDRLETLESGFASVLTYCAQQLGVLKPIVYRCPDFSDGIDVGATRPPVLLIGSDTLAGTDRIELAFQLGRALTQFWPGRAIASHLPPGQLKLLLLATVALSKPDLDLPDPTGEIHGLKSRFEKNSPSLAEDAAPAVARLVAQAHGKINISRHLRGIARTAARAGFILCNDLPTAAKLSSEAAHDLIGYALSDEYGVIREKLGLTISV